LFDLSEDHAEQRNILEDAAARMRDQ